MVPDYWRRCWWCWSADVPYDYFRLGRWRRGQPAMNDLRGRRRRGGRAYVLYSYWRPTWRRRTQAAIDDLWWRCRRGRRLNLLDNNLRRSGWRCSKTTIDDLGCWRWWRGWALQVDVAYYHVSSPAVATIVVTVREVAIPAVAIASAAASAKTKAVQFPRYSFWNQVI